MQWTGATALAKAAAAAAGAAVAAAALIHSLPLIVTAACNPECVTILVPIAASDDGSNTRTEWRVASGE